MNKQEAIEAAEYYLNPGDLNGVNVTKALVYATLAIALCDTVTVPVDAPSPLDEKFVDAKREEVWEDGYNNGYDVGVEDAEKSAATTILRYLDDPYKPPEGKLQLIRESCQYLMGQK